MFALPARPGECKPRNSGENPAGRENAKIKGWDLVEELVLRYRYRQLLTVDLSYSQIIYWRSPVTGFNCLSSVLGNLLGAARCTAGVPQVSPGACPTGEICAGYNGGDIVLLGSNSFSQLAPLVKYVQVTMAEISFYLETTDSPSWPHC
ncbi:hypothetical protein RRG08_052583 [Elysia crispata]|uniref:Uncharacterized protein n=1 Tax=Elysia crispata TaxID=231223 RepID=A0AAE1A2B1_9GAST|nr:hypothetical protein RRG08_052583 [Elysia crispata]